MNIIKTIKKRKEVFHKVQYEYKQRINKAMSSEYNLYTPIQYR